MIDTEAANAARDDDDGAITAGGEDNDTRPPDVVGGEKATLVAFLDYLREAVAVKVEGVADDAARRPGVRSGTSLLGLLKHLAGVERVWFQWAFEGRDPSPDLDMDPADSDTVASLLVDYRAAARRSNEIIAACDDLGRVSVRTERSLRWILVHMIEETARHAGHADILRERIDGLTG
ncbi:MAG: DinB family protein, partial [Actinocrinis sp.]